MSLAASSPAPVTRLRVVHRTGFRYDSPVAASYNEARMTPLTTATQAALEARLQITPVTWTHAFIDYWGTPVTAFEVLTPHLELSVVSSCTVECRVPRDGADLAGWDALVRDDVRDANVEFLVQSGRTAPPEEVVSLARDAAADRAPDVAARAVCERLGAVVEYQPGVTGVHSGAREVWAARQGVCQDFAHLSLGALRSLGIPARYVSGYLHPKAEAGVGETVRGESHAWIEWWAGEWVGYDPTSGSSVGADHVVVARGRDYADVTPLKGVYAGASGSQLFVSVEVTRLS